TAHCPVWYAIVSANVTLPAMRRSTKQVTSVSETTEPQPNLSDRPLDRPPSPAIPTRTRQDDAQLARSLEDLQYELAGIGPRRRAFSRVLTEGTRASGDWL